LLKSII